MRKVHNKATDKTVWVDPDVKSHLIDVLMQLSVSDKRVKVTLDPDNANYYRRGFVGYIRIADTYANNYTNSFITPFRQDSSYYRSPILFDPSLITKIEYANKQYRKEPLYIASEDNSKHIGEMYG